MQTFIRIPRSPPTRFYFKSLTKLFLSFLILGTFIIFNYSSSLSAQNQTSKIKAGTLICKSKGGIGLIVGSKENLSCTYSPLTGGSRTKYRGTITRFGLDLGIKGQSEIIWDVLGSSTSLRADTLSGNYAGIAADVALGVGGGAQFLLGGTDKSVVLQPLSVKGQTGFNIAAGVAGLVLRRR